MVREAERTLAGAGIESPRVDAELLAAHVLGVARGALPGAPDPTGAQLVTFRELVARRASRVPLQHLTGTAPFRHLELAVGPGVFVPRPETEQLVEWGLRWLGPGFSPLVVDLCAGSGAIALSVEAELSGSQVYAVELAPLALKWLRRNASGTGVRVVAGDVLDPDTLSDLDGTVDLVLCNPPYVPEVDPEGHRLPPEVTDHDPPSAVFAGPDGLAVIGPLVGRVARLLRPRGGFGVEHGSGHAEAVGALLRADGRFTDVQVHDDLAGRPRFTTARRSG
jgi:release factor glutamine methyltransferase